MLTLTVHLAPCRCQRLEWTCQTSCSLRQWFFPWHPYAYKDAQRGYNVCMSWQRRCVFHELSHVIIMGAVVNVFRVQVALFWKSVVTWYCQFRERFPVRSVLPEPSRPAGQSAIPSSRPPYFSRSANKKDLYPRRNYTHWIKVLLAIIIVPGPSHTAVLTDVGSTMSPADSYSPSLWGDNKWIAPYLSSSNYFPPP